jgi:hypothetical protein
MESPNAQAPGNRAAIASRQAQRVVVIACLLAGWAWQQAGAGSRGVEMVPLPLARAPLDAGVARVALRLGDSDTVLVGELAYRKNAREMCGEVNGIDSSGAAIRFKDGIRIFMCGPGFHD